MLSDGIICLIGPVLQVEAIEEPATRRMRIGQRLLRRKGFRRDDEERLCGIKVSDL